MPTLHELTPSEAEHIARIREIRESGGLSSTRPAEIREVRDAAQYAASNED